MKPIDVVIVDDTPENIKLIEALLDSRGFSSRSVRNGASALEEIDRSMPDLVIMDVMMPGMSGYDICRALRKNPATALLPVIMLTALNPAAEKIKGLESGADDFISKPINQPELFARIESLLRISALQRELADKNAQLQKLNSDLEIRVAKQTQEISDLNRLKRFLPTQVASDIVSKGEQDFIRQHRREITIVFIELRKFGNLVMEREPEEVIVILNELYHVLSQLIAQFDGTVQRFSSDEIVLFFNDPIPVDNPPLQAVSLAHQFRIAFKNLKARWTQKGYEMSLTYGVGISTGFATLGMMGFEGREDYTAIGVVTEIAPRLCREARPGEILLDARTQSRLNSDTRVKPRGAIVLKDIDRSVETFGISS
jgi:DNA-binding response OmpR family regulator